MPQIILSLNTLEDKIFVHDSISCYLLSDALPPVKINEAVATGKMVLCRGNKALDVCRQYNLDGVVKEIDTTQPVKIQLKPLREALKKKTLGVIIPARRHEAMLSGEVEPEFIAFRSDNTLRDKEIISWYNELFLIPLAWDAEDRAGEVKDLDVDFVIINAKNFEDFGC